MRTMLKKGELLLLEVSYYVCDVWSPSLTRLVATTTPTPAVSLQSLAQLLLSQLRTVDCELSSVLTNDMGSYLSSWSHGLACSQPQKKYQYITMESFDGDPENPPDDPFMTEEETSSCPSLPIEVWSCIIAQLPFDDKVKSKQILCL